MADQSTTGDEKQHHSWEGDVPVLHGRPSEDEQRTAVLLADKEAETRHWEEQLVLTKAGNNLTKTYVRLTLLLAFISALGTCAAWYQGRSAEIAAHAAQSAAETASNTLNEMKIESQRTLNASKEEMNLDQRAWLGLSELTISPLADGTLEQEGFASNSGKTPALKVQAVTGLYTEEGSYIPGDRDFKFIPYIVEKAWNREIKPTKVLSDAFYRRDPHYHGILPPQNTFRAQVFAPQLRSLGVIPPGNAPHKLPLPPPVNAGIVTTFIFYGEIQYFDAVSKEQHRTQFCYYQLSQTINFYPCDQFNDMK